MKRSVRVLCFVLAVGLFVPALALPAFAAAPSVSAAAYCLMDGESGRVLLSENADRRLPMASTTKIMTCLVALEAGGLDKIFTVPRECEGIEGSSMYLFQGERLTLRQLLYGLMLESANDAAVAISLAVSGSVPAFVEEMNRRAAEWGLRNTHFVNPNGLSAEEHYSSAHDLARLLQKGLENPDFAVICGTKNYRFTSPDAPPQSLSNHNRLLKTLPDCIGGKTGFTTLAGRCLVSACRRNGKTLIVSTLNAPDDWNDHRLLFDYGYSLYEWKTLFSPGDVRFSVPVAGAAQEEVCLSNRTTLTVPLFSGEDFQTVTECPRFLYAPLLRDSAAAEISVWQGGREVGRLPLFPEEDVAPLHIPTLWEKIRIWFKQLFS